jgi:hypothetical protein
MNATVTGVFTDVDDEVLVAVTVDDDPATEAWRGRVERCSSTPTRSR